MTSFLGLEDPAWTGSGILALLPLVFLPGAWITFGFPLRAIPMWARMFTAAVLSPLVVCTEFYILRWLGIPFAAAAVFIPIANLPAIWLILRNSPKLSVPGRQFKVAVLFTVGLCILLMGKALISIPMRIYSPHAWLYSDPIYMFARGDLKLEDPSLAGVPLGYPIWSALVFQAVASFLLNSPPVSSWVWVNLIWLLLICGFVAGIAKELGGGRLAQAAAGVWVTLGINPVGYLLLVTLPGLASHRLFGDMRYTPWITKFFLFSTMPFGLGLIAALLYLLIQPGRLTKSSLAAAGLLAGGTGLLYPLLFPPACGVLGAKALALLADRSAPTGDRFRGVLRLAAVVAIAASATYLQVRFLEHGRPPAATPPLELSTLSSGGRKALASVIVTSVLLLALGFVVRKCRRGKPQATTVLLAGAAASYALHAAFSIAYWDNEYKFITVIPLCLAPFAALATEWVWRRSPRPLALTALTLTAVLLVVPFLHQSFARGPSATERTVHPGPLDTSAFYLRLSASNPWSAICSSIRTATPPDTVLVTENSDYYFPELTARSMYVPAADRFYPGVTLGADVLEAAVRGNGRAILDQRRAVLAGLFDSDQKQEALDRLLELNRPLAILVEPRHASLQRWLVEGNRGWVIYQHDGVAIWLVTAPQGVRPGTLAQTVR